MRANIENKSFDLRVECSCVGRLSSTIQFFEYAMACYLRLNKSLGHVLNEELLIVQLLRMHDFIFNVQTLSFPTGKGVRQRFSGQVIIYSLFVIIPSSCH